MRKHIHSLFGTRLRLGLSKRAFALVREQGWSKTCTVLAEASLTEDIALEQLVAQCHSIFNEHESKGSSLDITLSDEWARLFMVTPPQNCTRLQDLQAATAMRFQALYGDAMTAWHVEADWQATDTFLACAVPKKLIDTLQSLAKENGLRLAAIQPNFVAAWNATCSDLNKDHWIGVMHDQQLTLGAISSNPQQQLAAVRHYAIPETATDASWLREQVARLALQIDAAVPQQMSLLGNRQLLWISKDQKPDAKLPHIVNFGKDSLPASPESAISSIVMLARSEAA